MNYLICLSIIFCSGYYYSVTSKGSNITVLLLMLCIVLLLLKNRNLKIKKRSLYFFIFFEFIIFVSAFFSGNIGKGSIKQSLLVFCALLITNIYSWKKFKRIYVEIMKWISIFAIFGYIVSRTSLINLFPIVTNYNGVDYFSGIIFSVIRYPYIGSTIRMHGILWEPGLLASYEIIAIMFLEKNNRCKKKYYFMLFLFTFSVLMSKSGAGLTLLPISLLIKWLEEKDRKSLKIFKVVVIGVIIGMITVTTLGDRIYANKWLNKYMFSKIANKENSSFLSRKSSILIDFKIGLENLPFGVGIDGYVGEIEKYRYKDLISSSGTSTLTTYVAEFGILGFVMLVFWIVGLYNLGNGMGIFTRIGNIFITLCILSKEPHGNLLFMNCVLLYSLSNLKLYLRSVNKL